MPFTEQENFLSSASYSGRDGRSEVGSNGSELCSSSLAESELMRGTVTNRWLSWSRVPKGYSSESRGDDNDDDGLRVASILHNNGDMWKERKTWTTYGAKQSAKSISSPSAIGCCSIAVSVNRPLQLTKSGLPLLNKFAAVLRRVLTSDQSEDCQRESFIAIVG